MKLIIVGNGFDLAHGLPSRFKDFKNYLLINDSSLKDFLESLFPKKQGDDFLLWSDFERALASPDPMFLNELSLLSEGKNDLLLKEFLDEAFKKWVTDFCYSSYAPLDEKCAFKPYIVKDNIYLSFNYTSTLEELYGIKDVLHIHGKLIYKDHEYPREIIYGHGKENIKDARLSKLYKPVANIIQKNRSWFRELSGLNIEEVVLIGFSCSEIDLPYLLKINEAIPNKRWVFFHYSKTDLSAFQKVARQLDLKNISFYPVNA